VKGVFLFLEVAAEVVIIMDLPIVIPVEVDLTIGPITVVFSAMAYNTGLRHHLKYHLFIPDTF
jgi:hypothetical protein